MRSSLMASAAAVSPATLPNIARPARQAAAAAVTTEEPAAVTTAAAPPARAADDEWEDDPDDEDSERKKDDHSQKRKKSKAATARTLISGIEMIAMDDDDGDRADQQNPTARAARSRQRGWFKAVLGSEAGLAVLKADPQRAIEFALTFTGTRQEAIATLKLFGGMVQPQRETLADRVAAAATVPTVRPVDTPARTTTNPQEAMHDGTTAAAIIKAGQIRRGEIAA